MSSSPLIFLDNDVHLYAYRIGCVWTHALIHRALETDLYRHPHPAVMLKLMAVVLTHCQTEEGPIAEERGWGVCEKDGGRAASREGQPQLEWCRCSCCISFSLQYTHTHTNVELQHYFIQKCKEKMQKEHRSCSESKAKK